jgi:hypothetical protein
MVPEIVAITFVLHPPAGTVVRLSINPFSLAARLD